MPGSTVSRTRAVYSEREGALIEQARPMQMPCVEPPESQNVDLIGIKLFEDLREPNRVLPRTTRGGCFAEPCDQGFRGAAGGHLYTGTAAFVHVEVAKQTITGLSMARGGHQPAWSESGKHRDCEGRRNNRLG